MSNPCPAEWAAMPTHTPDAWQPIATAPKDSTRILIYVVAPSTGEERIYLAWWAIPYEAAPDDRGWWETGLYGTTHPVVPEYVTHWRPLYPPAHSDDVALLRAALAALEAEMRIEWRMSEHGPAMPTSREVVVWWADRLRALQESR